MKQWNKISLDDDFRSLWLKRNLTERNMTVTDLANILGVKRATVSRWINRDWKDSQRTTGLNKVTYLAICYAFGIKLEDAEKEWRCINKES